ncbi:two-component system sensor histidine kinase UhpB [Bradyrhizobium sp. AZCC 1610]|uniref:sensor histidine kinase n=1 Tax=Bradyrhizobium sp. AZCC 1610 TaxID=3117020 RepID=UPI002FF25CC1
MTKNVAQRPLILLVMAAAIPLVLFAGWVVFLNARQERTDSRLAALETLDRVVTRLSSELGVQVQIAETLAASATLDKPDLGSFYLEALRVKEARPLWETIELVDPQGNQVLNLLRPIGADLGATADRENFERILRTRKAAIGGIGPLGPISGKRLIALRAPVERNGELKYVLTIALVPDAVSQILKGVGAPTGWIGAVVDAKGNIVARTIGEQFELGRPASQSVREAIAQGPEGAYIGTTLEGHQVDSIYKELPGTNGWSVHLGIPTDQLDAPVRRSVVFLAGGGAVSLALALALVWFTARDISQRRQEQEAQAALALKASEERRRLTIDAADLGVFSWNFRTGEVVASARALEMLHLEATPGLAETSLSFERLLASIDPADRSFFEPSFLQCRDGKAVVVDFRTAPPNGRWLRASGRVSSLDRSAADSVFSVLLDIEETKRAELERHQLLRRLGQAEENERRRIARELHDQIGQTVTGLLLGLKSLEQSLGDVPARAARLEKLHWLQGLARAIGRDIHQIAADLRPTGLDDLGLYKALEAFCSEWSRRFGVNVDVQVLGNIERPAADVEIAVYRAIQEALNNVVKHASARNVSIVLDRRNHELRIIVEDDGCGFDTQELTRLEVRNSKLGLSVIEERLVLLGGSLTIESQPSNGTTLFMMVPLSGRESDP